MRLIEFGRCAIANRRTQGLGKPESFDFLGVTHYATRRSGSGFVLGRKPGRKIELPAHSMSSTRCLSFDHFST
jgi:hypothetical protein